MYRKATKLKKPVISNEELIRDLKRVSAIFNHHYFCLRDYEKHGNYNPKTMKERFGFWMKALKTASVIHYDDSIIGKFFDHVKVIERIKRILSLKKIRCCALSGIAKGMIIFMEKHGSSSYIL